MSGSGAFDDFEGGTPDIEVTCEEFEDGGVGSAVLRGLGDADFESARVIDFNTWAAAVGDDFDGDDSANHTFSLPLGATKKPSNGPRAAERAGYLSWNGGRGKRGPRWWQ